MSSVDTENVTAHLSSLRREESRREKQVIDNVVAVLADGNRPFTRSEFWDDPKLTHFEKIGLELDKALARPRAANPARLPSSGSKRRRKRVRSKSEAKRRAEGFFLQREYGIAYSDSGSGDTLDCYPLSTPLAQRSAGARSHTS